VQRHYSTEEVNVYVSLYQIHSRHYIRNFYQNRLNCAERMTKTPWAYFFSGTRCIHVLTAVLLVPHPDDRWQCVLTAKFYCATRRQYLSCRRTGHSSCSCYFKSTPHFCDNSEAGTAHCRLSVCRRASHGSWDNAGITADTCCSVGRATRWRSETVRTWYETVIIVDNAKQTKRSFSLFHPTSPAQFHTIKAFNVLF